MVCSGPSSLATHNKFRCQINNEHHLWRCIHCDRSFKTPQSLQRHKNIHKGLKPYACRICGKVFSHPSSRKRHYSLHFNMICSCKMCGMAFHNTITLARHEKAVHAYKRHSNGKFECTECDKVFADWKCLRRHKKRLPHRNADVFTCKTCGKLFRKKENLLRHEALHKPSFLGKPYKCQHCGMSFLSGVGLSNHKRIHLNKNAGEGKSDKGESSQKITSNSVEKYPTKDLFAVRGKKYSTRHVCQICKAPFAYSFNLARHIRAKHPRVKVIKCGKCAKVCVSKRELALHIAMKHETRKDDSKQFSLESAKCSQCNLTYPECQLLNHTCIYQKAKANEGTTVQNVESKRTVQASDGKYNISRSISQDQTSYSSMEFRCEFCTKGFPSLSLMHRHRAVHFRKENLSLPISLDVSSKASDKERPCIYQKVLMNEGATAQESESKRTVQGLDGKCNISQSSSQDQTAYISEEFRCEFCAKGFPSLSLMHCHRASHFRRKNPALVNPCGISSITPNKETPHLDKAQPRNGQFCNKPFNSKESLRQHKCYRAENATSVVPWSSMKRVESSAVHCKVCNKSFHKETSLRAHMTHHSRNASQSNHLSPPNLLLKSSKFQVEDKRFKCDICAREFITEDSLRSHKRLHSRFGKMQVKLPKQVVDVNAQEPRVCNVCCESFQSNRSLSQHKRSHAGIKTAFACPFCRKGFSFKQNLLRHKRRHHDRPYKCQRCGEGFRTLQGRLRHCLKHDSVKLDQKCSSSTETGPAKCEALRVPQICCLHCDKRFMTRKGCYKHMRKYHSEESKVGLWKCPNCSKVFQNDSAMKEHFKNTHAKRKWSDDQQGYKKEDKDGIETTNSKVAKRTEADAIAPWKCQFCSKVFQSVSGMKKHVKKKHSKRRKSEASHQGCKPEEKDSIEITNRKVTQRTQSWSEWEKIAPWKCLFCTKVFLSVSGVKKHVKKKHSKRRKSEASHQGCKPEENDSIEITKSKETQRTQSWSEWAKRAPWKCQFCSKICQSVSDMQKHVKKKHSKCGKSEASHQGCKPEEKDSIETNNSKVTQRTQSWSEWAKRAPWKCQFCSKICQSVSDMQKHVKKKHSKCGKSEASHQGCKLEEKDVIDTNNGKVTQRTQSWSEGGKVSPWKCQFCSKVFQSVSGMKKHVTKKHSKCGKSEASHQGCKLEEKDGIETNNGEVTQRTQSWSEGGKVSPWKCQFCSKVFQSVRDMQKHVKKKHSKCGKSEASHQGCNLEEKDGIETNNSKVTQRTQSWSEGGKGSPWKCQFCSKVFQSVSGMRKHVKKKHSKCGKSKASHQGCNLEEKDGIETNNSKVTQRTQSWSEGGKGSPWKCQFCSKVFQSVSGMRKHVKKKHSKCGKSEASHQGCKLEEKDGIETNNSKVTKRTQSWSERGKGSPWKCQFCSKIFQSVSGMKKHVTKKHSKRERYQSPDQGCKQEEKNGTEVTSSVTAKGAQNVCRRCEVRFFAFGSDNKCVYCIHCNRELSLDGNDNGSGFGDEFVGSGIQDRMQFVCQKKHSPLLVSVRAFQCQYCQKGVSKINDLYKHIMIAHGKEFGSNDHGSCTRFVNQSERKNDSTHQAFATEESIEVFQNFEEGPKLTRNRDAQPRGVKFSTVSRKAGTLGTKRTAQCNRFRCWSRREYLSRGCRGRHGIQSHANQLGSSSLRPKLDVDKTFISRPLHERPRWSKDENNREGKSRACIDGPHVKECYSRNKAFPCEYCPKQFLRVASRYRHVMLVHTGATKVCQLKPQVPADKTGETMPLFCSDRSIRSSSAPIKRKKDISNLDCQLENKKFRRHDVNFGSDDRAGLWSFNKQTVTRRKAFQCEFCDRRFSSFSLQCKHFFLVHSGSLADREVMDSKTTLTVKVSKLADPFNAECNGSASSYSHGDLTRRHISPSQRNILRNGRSDTENCLKMPSVAVTTGEPYKCEICCTILRTKSERTKHFNEIHCGSIFESSCSINRLPRHPLRTISWSLQSRNNLKSLATCGNMRQTGLTTCGKQVKVSSVGPGTFVERKSKKRFKCEICHSMFTQKRSVLRHMNSRHSDEKPFQCAICGYATKRKDHLSAHERSHFS